MIGIKKKRLFDEFIKEFIPTNIKTYVEPFGGSYAVHSYLPITPLTSIYNDITAYTGLDIDANEIYHEDYKFIFKKYDSIDTVFYLDPPYYGKEHFYDCKRYDKEFHQELHDEIKKLVGKVILSYEDKPFIRKLYSDMNIHKYNKDYLIFDKEIIITNQ